MLLWKNIKPCDHSEEARDRKCPHMLSFHVTLELEFPEEVIRPSLA